MGYQAVEANRLRTVALSDAVLEIGTALAPQAGMTTSRRIVYVRRRAGLAVISASLLLGGSVLEAAAQPSASSAALSSWSTQLTPRHIGAALVSPQPRNRFRWISTIVDAGPPRKALRLTWSPVEANPGRRWPLRADPRRWPRLFANTTECTLSFDPVLRRHWWQ